MSIHRPITVLLAEDDALVARMTRMELESVGFTVIGTDRKGNPVYIGGPRGSIERNAVRYYFAIRSVLA